MDLVSGDVPGAASRYIENHFNDKMVALWSEGAAGDQKSDLLPADIRFTQDFE